VREWQERESGGRESGGRESGGRESGGRESGAREKHTLKPWFNKSEGTKDFVFYSRGFVIAEAFYYRIKYRGT
jgi:hypothetical protein